MVCLRNISVDTLHKGDTEDDDDDIIIITICQLFQIYDLHLLAVFVLSRDTMLQT